MNSSTLTKPEIAIANGTAVFVCVVSFLLNVLICSSAPCAEPQDRPNIILILADDLGWHDLGCYGNSLFETPNLDRFANQGLRFTQAYAAAPICSASRASILTGKTPARLGFEFVTKNERGFQPVRAPLRAPPYTLDLPQEETTIAESLAAVGYQTAFFGKWHLNRHHQRYLGWSPTHGPKQQGFQVAEEDFGSHPYSYWNDKSKRTFTESTAGKFPSDSMTDRATAFIRSPHDKPFFLMVSHFYVHTPVHSRLKWLHDHYAAKIPAENPRAKSLAHYAAMVTTLDHHVGKLLSAIDGADLTESTLVVFTSDNGGHPQYAGNAPLRGSKWNLYEGGIRVPMIVRWPGRTKPASTSDDVVSGTDLFPTFAAAAMADVPAKIDGVPLFSGTTARKHLWHFPYYHPETTFHKSPTKIGVDDGVTSQTRPHSALRSGPWKLVHFYEDDRDELYYLPSDLAEKNDRSQTDPTITARLRQEFDEAINDAGARIPTPHPDVVSDLR